MTTWSAHSLAVHTQQPPQNLKFWQVLASLLVSVLLVGFKLNGAKEIVHIIQRRKELKANLFLLQKGVEEEDKKELLQQEETKDEKEKMATRHREQRVTRKGERFKGAYKCLGG